MSSVNFVPATIEITPQLSIQQESKPTKLNPLKNSFSSQVEIIGKTLGPKTQKEELRKIKDQYEKMQLLFNDFEEHLNNKNSSCMSKYGSCVMYTFFGLGGLTQIGELTYSTFAPSDETAHQAFAITKYIAYGLGIFTIFADKVAYGLMAALGGEDPEKDRLQCKILKMQSSLLMQFLDTLEDSLDDKNIEVKEQSEIDGKLKRCFDYYKLLSSDVQQQIQLSRLISFCLYRLPPQHPLRKELENLKSFISQNKGTLKKVKQIERTLSLPTIWKDQEQSSKENENLQVKLQYQQSFQKLESEVKQYFKNNSIFDYTLSLNHLDIEGFRLEEDGIEEMDYPNLVQDEVTIDIPPQQQEVKKQKQDNILTMV
jgi:hypothetical protein